MIVTTYEGYDTELISPNILIYASVPDFYNGIKTPEYMSLVSSYGIPITGNVDYFLQEDTIPGYSYPNSFVGWSRTVGYWTSNLRLFRKIRQPTPAYPVKPCYADLINGYSLDVRSKKPNNIFTVKLTNKLDTTISYYQQNTLESFPDLKTLDWIERRIKLNKYNYFSIDLTDVVLGTLMIDDSSITTLIKSKLNALNYYPNLLYFNSELASIFTNWNSIYQSAINLIPVQTPPQVIESLVITEFLPRVLHRLAANNNCWNNDNTVYTDLNFDPNNQLCIIDSQVDYQRHIQTQPDGSTGSLIMDSPRLKNLDAAFNAFYWATNPDNPDVPRVDNLGWRTNRICEILGIRVKPDGTIDEALEKTTNRRLHAEGTDQNDPQKNNPNCFGSETMLIRHLPNKFSPSGTVAGGYRMVKDIPQLLAEQHEQANAAMGYQEGTAIEIQVDGQTYRYANQLALMTEIFVTLKQSAVYSKGAFFSSVVGEQSIKEVISGLGLRTVDKYLEFKVAGKIVKLYYKGVSASQSIRRKMSAMATNIGTIIGNIT